MTTVLYRLNGGEAMKISQTNQPFSQVDPAYYGVLTDPAFPDGTAIHDPSGTLRVLGYAKYVDLSGPTVRNAIQAELDNFPVAQQTDRNGQDAFSAKEFLNTHPRWRKVLKALAKLLIAELLERQNVKSNTVIGQWEQFKTDVANSSNLGDLKTAVAALPAINANLPETATLSQFMTQIENYISGDD